VSLVNFYSTVSCSTSITLSALVSITNLSVLIGFIWTVVANDWDMAMSSVVTQQQPDAWYAALLGLAEHFRTSNPPNVKHCVHCLQTVFAFKPPPSIEARTHLQIGTVLSNHTKNIDLALSHLDRAVSVSHCCYSVEFFSLFVTVSWHWWCEPM